MNPLKPCDKNPIRRRAIFRLQELAQLHEELRRPPAPGDDRWTWFASPDAIASLRADCPGLIDTDGRLWGWRVLEVPLLTGGVIAIGRSA